MDGFVAAKQEGLLEAYNSPNYANLLDQAKYKDADNQYVGHLRRLAGLLHQQGLAGQEPRRDGRRSRGTTC